MFSSFSAVSTHVSLSVANAVKRVIGRCWPVKPVKAQLICWLSAFSGHFMGVPPVFDFIGVGFEVLQPLLILL